MTGTLLRITPQDTISFRDGRPFEQGDQGLVEAVDRVPPPTALHGAVKSALAGLLNITGNPALAGFETWSQALSEGPGTEGSRALWDTLSALNETSISGPFVVDRALRDLIYYPCPSFLLFAETWGGISPVGHLAPTGKAPFKKGKSGAADWAAKLGLGMAAVFADKNKVEEEGLDWQPATQRWIRGDALEAILKNAGHRLQGDDTISEDRLFARENRVGIGIDPLSGRAADGMLYLAGHRRLTSPSNNGELSLVAVVSGDVPLPEDLDISVPFGGEGRFARLQRLQDPVGRLPDACPFAARPKKDNRGAATNGVFVVALTPVPVKGTPFDPIMDALPLADFIYRGVVCNRLETIGFADPEAREKGRQTMARMRIKKCFPAGTTWFFEIDDTARKQIAKKTADVWDAATTRAGADADLAKLGFGALTIGIW